VRLRAGDIILLKGYSTSFEKLEYDQDFITIKKKDLKDYNKGKMVASLAVLIGVIIVSVMGLLPIVISALVGIIIIVRAGVIKPHEAYKAVDWSVIFLMVRLNSLCVDMHKSCTANLLPEQIINRSSGPPNIATLLLFYVLTAFLTNFISKNVSVT